MEADAFHSYHAIHAPEQLAEFVGRVLKSPVIASERVDYGQINAVSFVRLANGTECVAKLAPQERGQNAFRQEVWAYERCRLAGVPTPEVLAFDPEPSDFPNPALSAGASPARMARGPASQVRRCNLCWSSLGGFSPASIP